MSVVFLQQEFLKKEQERKEAELLAERQEALRKRKDEKRIARQVTNKSFFIFFGILQKPSLLRALRYFSHILTGFRGNFLSPA